MQFIAREPGLKISEALVTIRYSDLPKRNVLKLGLNVIVDILRLVGKYRPLLFFDLPDLVTLLGLVQCLGSFVMWWL